MAKITEDYVSFEMAKLLKEKGFDVPCLTCWYIGSEAHEKFNDSPFNYNEIKSVFEWLSRPTLQMVMRWLREVHDLLIIIRKDICVLEGFKGYFFVIESAKGESFSPLGVGTPTKIYEDAVEAAIKYCLENLI